MVKVYVITEVANLYKDSSFKSELVSQAFKNEKLSVLDKSNNWYKVKQWDNYISWINSFYVSENNLNTKKNIDPHIFTEEKFLLICKEYLGTPYLWGGKSIYGCDCSGLVQSVYKNFNLLLPRDSSDQINFEPFIEVDISNISIADLLFFGKNKVINHVAIYIGNGEIIHSSGYVKIEKLKNNNNLMKKLQKIKSPREIFNE